MTALLETRALTRRFGGLVAVDNVSIAVEQGTILGVIGPNGAGKSTFVNLVTGHLKPTSGHVLVSGQDVTGTKPWTVAALGVARTFQIVKPFRGMTVRENVALGSMFTGEDTTVTGAVRTADRVLERVGLADRRDAHPTELTVASLKRLELAKALAMQPKLLLLDEVMAGLRPSEVTDAVALIRSLRDTDGVTIIAIEHVMRAIVAISDEVVVLHKGGLLTHGAPAEVLADARVVEAYLGERYAKAQVRAQEEADARTAGGGGGGDGAAVVSLNLRGQAADGAAATTRKPLLEVRGLRAGYGDVGVLWDVDVDVAAGEVVALVGSNGAGKTTLLRTVSGVISPTAGSVRFDGHDLARLPAERIVERGLAHVPEGRRLFPGLSVRENLLMGAFHRRQDAAGVAEDLERVLELFPRMRERIDQVSGLMSGGEQQMCAIARGLMSRPRLIMIDELSLGLAPNLVDQLIERLAAIAETGVAVLLVEQDVVAALEVAARAYVVESGRVTLQGTSAELAVDPRVREAYLGVA